MVSVKTLRAACLIACAGLFACTPTRESTAPTPAPAPVQVQPEKPAEAAAPPVAPPQAAPAPPAPKAAKKSAPRRKKPAPKPAPPPPVVKAPEPPAAIVPAISPEQQRARLLDDYIAALQKSQLAFDPPSPVEVERRVAVTLSVNPPKEAAPLAEDLRKSLADPAAWRPRLRAQLGGASFDIAAADSAGEKDLAARTEWAWNIVPKQPGRQPLTARVAILLPPGLGEPRELPALQREVRVEATLAWTLGNIASEYWPWILAVLAVAIALAALLLWRKLRFAGES